MHHVSVKALRSMFTANASTIGVQSRCASFHPKFVLFSLSSLMMYSLVVYNFVSSQGSFSMFDAMILHLKFQEGFAFCHCTTCKTPYHIRVHTPADRKWRALKFRFFVTRDILSIFLLVQMVQYLSCCSFYLQLILF